MAVAFRAATNLVAAGATSAAQNKPTGTVDNDILIAGVYVEDRVTVTAPGGWSLIAQVADVVQPFDFYVYWKRAASEGASWSWTWSGSHWRDGFVVALSGAVTSGSPLDGTAAGAVGSDATAECTSITLAETDSLILTLGAWWNSNSATPPTGSPTFTERVDTGNNIYTASASATASGAVGTKTITVAGTTEWTSLMIAIRSQVTGAADPFPAGYRLGRYQLPNRQTLFAR